jgi:hypothetical protein
MERRHTTRYNFGAIAEVIDLGSRREFVAITRDLSLSGCFIKTTTPLAEGAEIRVRITSSGEDFAAIGKVTPNVTPVGMGIEFVRDRPERSSDRIPGEDFEERCLESVERGTRTSRGRDANCSLTSQLHILGIPLKLQWAPVVC